MGSSLCCEAERMDDGIDKLFALSVRKNIITGMGMTLKQYKDAMNVCHPIRFGSRISPQWRDRIILQIADQLGYRVSLRGAFFFFGSL